ncbi:MAG TPA: hypothetical protein VHO69_15080 [Phototrophicaceae bacterium]|nr:hypothetical protein [Phototrophicaceae bacterium]
MKAILEKPAGIMAAMNLPMNTLKTVLFYLLALGLGGFLISCAPRDFNLMLAETRPLAQVVALGLGLLALWCLVNAAWIFAQRPRQVAWRVSVQLVGWIGMVAAFGGVWVLAAGDGDAPYALPIAGAARAIESIVPLVLAIQAALIFSPDDEPGLEVLLAAPRPASWLLLERLGILFVSQVVVVVAGVILCRFAEPDLDVLLTLVTWLAPAVLLMAIATFVTIRSRVAMFGATIAGMVWFVFAFFRAGLLPGMPTFWPLNLLLPFIWAFNPYLQPGDVPMGDYWINRVIVLGLGVGLLLLTVRQLRDEEQLLAGSRSSKGNNR